MKAKKVKRSKHYEPKLKVNSDLDSILKIALKTKVEKKSKKKRK